MKILKNNTVSDIIVTDVGQTVPGSSQLTIDASDYDKYAQSNDVIVFIANEDLTVNDGTNDLEIAEGVALIQGDSRKRDVITSLKNNDRIKVEVAYAVGESNEIYKVLVSPTDFTASFLENKVIGTANKIVITNFDTGGDEHLRLGIGTDVFDKSINDASDITNVPSGNIGSLTVQDAINELDSSKIENSEKGANDGVATLNSIGKVPNSQLPSFVDDVLEYANLASFPGTGETGKIYVAIDTGKTYRWSGSIYVEISASDVNSVFSRTGNVIAVYGDYSADKITNSPSGSIASTNIQDAINELDSEKQPIDSTLTALAAYNTDGFLVQTNTDTFTGRTITGTSGQISVSNGNGGSGNPTLSLSNVGVADTYGSASSIPVITTDIKGRVTDVTNTTVAILSTQVTDFNEAAQDAVGSILTDSGSVDFTYSDAGNTITAVVLPGGVDHNSLLNYSANRHIDHTTVSITAGTGLSGGGDISSTRTLNIANTGVSAGTYGSASLIPVLTINAQGQVTAASTQTPALSYLSSSQSANTITTTSTTLTASDINIVLTPGTWRVQYRCTVSSTSNNRLITTQLYSGITPITETLCTFRVGTGGNLSGGLIASNVDQATNMGVTYITVGSNTTITLYWDTSGGTGVIQERQLDAFKVSG